MFSDRMLFEDSYWDIYARGGCWNIGSHFFCEGGNSLKNMLSRQEITRSVCGKKYLSKIRSEENVRAISLKTKSWSPKIWSHFVQGFQWNEHACLQKKEGQRPLKKNLLHGWFEDIRCTKMRTRLISMSNLAYQMSTQVLRWAKIKNQKNYKL